MFVYKCATKCGDRIECKVWEAPSFCDIGCDVTRWMNGRPVKMAKGSALYDDVTCRARAAFVAHRGFTPVKFG